MKKKKEEEWCNDGYGGGHTCNSDGKVCADTDVHARGKKSPCPYPCPMSHVPGPMSYVLCPMSMTRGFFCSCRCRPITGGLAGSSQPTKSSWQGQGHGHGRVSLRGNGGFSEWEGMG